VYVLSYDSVCANNDLAEAILNCSINQRNNIYQTTRTEIKSTRIDYETEKSYIIVWLDEGHLIRYIYIFIYKCHRDVIHLSIIINELSGNSSWSYKIRRRRLLYIILYGVRRDNLSYYYNIICIRLLNKDGLVNDIFLTELSK